MKKINKLAIKVIILLYVVIITLDTIRALIFFNDHYYTCKWFSDYECIDIKYKRSNSDYSIDSSWDYDLICKLDYCLSVDSVIRNARKWAIENKWIKKLFLESIWIY